VTALLWLVAHVVQAANAGTPDVTQAFGNLWAYVGAFATSAALAGLKKVDTSITNSGLFRKLQPVITLGGAFAASALASHTRVTFDPTTLASAPLATVAAVTLAELGQHFFGKPKA
jgi:hypothetical protein